eukprot:4359912-Prymnesium_polylepis.1
MRVAKRARRVWCCATPWLHSATRCLCSATRRTITPCVKTQARATELALLSGAVGRATVSSFDTMRASTMDILTWKRDGEQIGKVARQLCSSSQPKPRWSPQLLERKLRELVAGGDCAINAFLLCSWARPTHVLVPPDQEALLKHQVCGSAVWALREMPDRVVQAVADVRVRGIDKRNAGEFARLVDARQSA